MAHGSRLMGHASRLMGNKIVSLLTIRLIIIRCSDSLVASFIDSFIMIDSVIDPLIVDSMA